MQKQSSTFNIASLKKDLPAGLVVFLVALPLCLGISLASGAPLFAGLITGIVGGVVVSMLSGSALSVSGPAAGLTVIVLNGIQSLGSFEAFLLAGLIAGFLQLVLGFAKAGIIGLYFPSSVIRGMLAAIGLILIIKQIPHFLGANEHLLGEMSFFWADGKNTFSEIRRGFNSMEKGALIIGLFALLILVIWESKPLQRISFFKLVPGALVAVIASVFLNQAFNIFNPDLFIADTHMVQLPVVASPVEILGELRLPDFSQITNPQIYITAFTIAIIASLETLLSVEAVDKLDPYKRITPPNRELKAQGIGNIVSALLGGLPMTAVIVRSSANVNAGGQTKLSSFVHGILLLLSVLFLSEYINHVPLSALAAILLMVGFKLTKPALYKAQWRLGTEQFIPFIITILAILFTDLLKGITVGLVIGIFYILRANYKSPFFFQKNRDLGEDIIRIQLSENVTFLNKASIVLTLDHLPENSNVIIDGSKSTFIDYDVLDAIHNFKFNASAKNLKVELIGIPEVTSVVSH
ncbi:SulP family inorganic anion transporter [Adhaeribacter aquaticus]|uniref:SulP family inorganic anion transporter n=1 Tax=Adhaeribacter aquaticus TaxID=299567 RepID=UPI00041FAED4|nr:SulP family inorganic anion transporter [Adhaeribacter aquaticus]